MSVLVFLILLGSFQSCSCLSKKKIYIGGLVPSYARDYFGYMAAMELATTIINNRSDVLTDYELVVKYRDTFGDEAFTIRYIFEYFLKMEEEPLEMIVGPAWSKNAEVSALTCKTFGVIQISYGATSIAFHLDDNKYSMLFSNIPTVSSFNQARLALIKLFGWKKLAILQEFDHALFTSAVQDLREQIRFQKLNLTFSTIEGFQFLLWSHPRLQLEKLKELDARIIIGHFTNQGAARVFCEAYKMGMYGPKYVWFLESTQTTKWIFSPDLSAYPSVTDCNVSMVAMAAEDAIIIDKISLRQDDVTSVSGLNSAEFFRQVRIKNPEAFEFSSYAFDAMWAAALAMNTSLSEPAKYHPGNVTISQYVKSDKYKTLLSATEFEGITGPHRFSNRQRLTTVGAYQIRLIDGKPHLVPIGRHNTFDDKLEIFPDEVDKMWKDGKIPVDEPIKETRIMKYSLRNVVAITTFSTLGVLYSLGFLCFNITRRNHKAVRLSSPLINDVVLVGCVLCYIYVILLGIDSRFLDDDRLGVLCNVRLYVLAISFSLSFGALFSKTWRVHKIFTARRAIKRKMMRDFHLLLFVLVLVIIDVVYITVWVYYNPLKLEDVIFEQEKETSADLVVIPILKICECTNRVQLLGGVYGYKGVLLLFGVFLAWETRNVTIPALNDSKYIGVSVYNVVILSALGVAVSVVLKKTKYYELLYVLVSTVVILSTTFTLTIMFLPKLHQYYTSEPEPQGRTRTLATLSGKRGSLETSVTEIDDVYEVSGKRDVKNKWVQTEEFEQATGKPRDAFPGDKREDFPDVVTNYALYEDIEVYQEQPGTDAGTHWNNLGRDLAAGVELSERHGDEDGNLVENDVTVDVATIGGVVNIGFGTSDQKALGCPVDQDVVTSLATNQV